MESTLPPGAYNAWTSKAWRLVTVDLAVPIDKSVSVEEHAAYIWRRQFEDIAVIDVGRPAHLSNHFDSFLEWWANVQRTGRKVIMTEQFCRMLAHAAWHAALRIAQAWREYIEVAIAARQKCLTMEEPWLLPPLGAGISTRHRL
jgi:hypothetical protein